MHTPILSLIIPTRDVAGQIAPLLESLDAARRTPGTTKQDLQLVVMDSASTDGTAAVIRPYLLEGDVFVSAKDRGIYDAMNNGVAAASGEWILFMGADDRLLLKDICSRLRAVASRPTQVIVGHARSGDVMLPGRWNWRLLFGHTVNQQACIYRRPLLVQHPYPLHYPIAADYWLHLKLFRAGTRTLTWHDQVISEYGSAGVSSLQLEKSLREQIAIRNDVLGPLGPFANWTRALKQKLV